MKLDKIKFAEVVNFIAAGLGREMSRETLEELDNIIDIDVPVTSPAVADKVMVNELVKTVAAMAGDNKNSFIPAVTAYRALTGCTLLEGKTFIEQYRVNKGAQLADILNPSYSANFDKFEG